MSVALRGNLEDFGIADVFQLIGQQRKTGVLEFRGENGEQVQLRFDRGAVVAAAPVGARAEGALAEMLVRCGKLTRKQVDELNMECEAAAQTAPRLALAAGWVERAELERIEDLLTRETFFHVLRWKRGAFDFHNQPVDHAREVDSLLGAEQILMDGLRMVDEWQTFSELVESDEVIFQRSAGFEEYRGRTSLDASQFENAERVYQLVDGRIPVRRIVDLSLLGSFDAMRLLADLRRWEVIEPLDEAAVRRLQTKPVRRVQLERSEALGWVAGLLATLVLAGLLGLTLRTPEPTAAPAIHAIERSAWQALQQAYAVRRARHALEAHRFRHGSWPASPAELAASGLVPAGALTAAPGRPYYYAKRDDGVVLLAPQR